MSSCSLMVNTSEGLSRRVADEQRNAGSHHCPRRAGHGTWSDRAAHSGLEVERHLMPQSKKPATAAQSKNKKDLPPKKKKGEVAPHPAEPVSHGDQPGTGREPWQ